MAVILDPVLTAGYTDWYEPEGYSVYVLELGSTVPVIKKLREYYLKAKPISEIKDEYIYNLPFRAPIPKYARAVNHYYDDDLETFNRDEAERVAREYEELGCYVVIVPMHIDFEEFFNEQDDDVKEKLVYHLDAFMEKRVEL